MTEQVTYHVVPGAHGGWNVQQENTGKIFGGHRFRTQAILQGRDLAQTHGYSLLVVHDSAGRVEKQYNYGKLPRSSPKDKPDGRSEDL
jgi:hypothetical protein